MKKILKYIGWQTGIFLFGLISLFGQTTVTVSGTTQVGTGGVCSGGTGGTDCFVRIRLRNYQGFVPRVVGTSIIVATQPADVIPNGSGVWSTTLWGNDNIQPNNCNPGGNHACTFYTFEFWYGGKMTSSANWQFIGAGPFNLNTLAPLSSPPPPPPPFLPVLLNPLGSQVITTGNLTVPDLGLGPTFVPGNCLQVGTGNFLIPFTCGGGGGGNAVITNPITDQDVYQPPATSLNISILNGGTVPYAASNYNWPQGGMTENCTVGCSAGALVANTPTTVTLTPCPPGVDTSYTSYFIYSAYISLTGTPEAVPITGGTCTSAAGSGTITFTPLNNHSIGWQIGSASTGLQEAINVAGAPGARVTLAPAKSPTPNYNIYATVFNKMNKGVLDGYGAILNCQTRSACLVNGDYANVNGYQNKIISPEFKPGTFQDGVQIVSVSASAGVYTVTTASPHPFINTINVGSCPPGTPSSADNCPGLDWVIFYYSTPAQTQEARVQVLVGNNCTPACSNVQFQYQIGSSTTFTTSTGYGWANIENAAIENLAQDLVLSDFKIRPPGNSNRFSWGIINSVDQKMHIYDPTTEGSGNLILCSTANFCGAFIYVRGDQGAAGITYINGGELSMQCNGNGIRNVPGNTLSVTDTVIQGYTQYGVYYGGGLQSWIVNDVYQESSNCPNPNYPGTLFSQAGYITNGSPLTIEGDMPIGGLAPSFVASNVGAQQNNYYVIPHSSLANYGPEMYIGSCLTTGTGNCTLYWPQIDLSGMGTVTWDILLTVGMNTNPPYLGNANSVTTVSSGVTCSSNGLCTFIDPQSGTTPYSITAPQFTPTLYFWPGGIVLGKGAHVYLNRCGQASEIIATSYLPSVFAKQSTVAGTNSSYTPFWCMSGNGDTSGGSGADPAASLLQAGTVSATATGKKGIRNYLNTGVFNSSDFLTWSNASPFQVLATPGYRPAWEAGDTAWGWDNPASSSATNVQLYLRTPKSFSTYINTTPNGTNYATRLNSTGQIFNTPVTTVQGLTALGSGCSGCSPYILGGNQATDPLTSSVNWTIKDGTWSFSGGQATALTNGADGASMAAYTASTFLSNQFSQASIPVALSGHIGVGVRMSNTTNTAYYYTCGTSGGNIFKNIAGVITSLTTTPACHVNDVLSLYITGFILTAYDNGIQQATTSDSTITSGFPGLACNAGTCGLSNWSGGDLNWGSNVPPRVTPVPFASLPPCTSNIEGAISGINDSTTNVWGATITGGGANHVQGYCDGTNWTVAAK